MTKSTHILIFTKQLTNRLMYACEVFFTNTLGLNIELTTNQDDFLASPLPKLNYSLVKMDDVLQIIPHTLLFETIITAQDIKVTKWNKSLIFFQSKTQNKITFDPFAACFYLVTRYEEYLSFTPDKHNRFSANQSLAYRNSFLHLPLVNIWAICISDLLKDKYKSFRLPSREFRCVSTIDIDLAYAYKYKSLARNIAAFSKDFILFKWFNIIKRIAVILTIKKDPFDTYSYLHSLHDKYKIKSIFFFLVGGYGQFDKNHSTRRRNFRRLIKNVSAKTHVGVHPSYGSNDSKDILKNEIDNLSRLLQEPIKYSRQHFLKLSMPETYRNYVQYGIKEDYTMGYVSKLGFRASICSSYYFYSLIEEEKTSLKIVPFQVMDNALQNQMKSSPEEAIEKMKEIIDSVKKVNGTFVSLWHNETVSEYKTWKGWREVFEAMLVYCKN